MILENLELFNSSRDFVKIKKLTQKIKTKRRRKKKKKEGKKNSPPPELARGDFEFKQGIFEVSR